MTGPTGALNIKQRDRLAADAPESSDASDTPTSPKAPDSPDAHKMSKIVVGYYKAVGNVPVSS